MLNQQEFEKKFQEIERNRPKQFEVLKSMLAGKKDDEITKERGTKAGTIRKQVLEVCNYFNIPEGDDLKPGQSRRDLLIKLFSRYKLEMVNHQSISSLIIKPPTGIVPLDSPLYLRRYADELCEQELTVDRSDSLPFIRIKGSKEMGKSSLTRRLNQFLHKSQKHAVGFIDLQSDHFEPEAFTSLDKLLYRFTQEITQVFRDKIGNHTPPDLKNYWKTDLLAPGVNCENYLRDHIFSKIDQQKTLFIDGVDVVFGQSVQHPFLQLLRTWSDTLMRNVGSAKIVWPSLVIAYSTEPYSEHGFQDSPIYNVGIALELEEFNADEILILAKRYGLRNWNMPEIESLMQLIGGHPALVNLALYEISKDETSLSRLKEQAIQYNSPFQGHLFRLLKILKEHESLQICFKKILIGERCADPFAKFQLERASLIRFEKEEVKVRCELYRSFFEENL